MAHAYDNNKNTLARGRAVAGRDITITVPANSTLLICAINVGTLTARTGGAPYISLGGSGTFTQADQNRSYASGEAISELWYLLGPPSGSLTVHVPDDNNMYITVDVASFTAGAGKVTAYSNANGATGSSTNPTCPSLTPVAGDVFVATCNNGATTFAPSNRTGTSLYEVDDGTYGHGSQFYVAPNTTAVAMSWTFGTSSTWGAVVSLFTETDPPAGPAGVKEINSILIGNVKTFNTLTIGTVKTINA